ncbi:MAG: tRNA uridine-5-carboxymethylaminomethyl(34) synthesis GTPase MnmE [Clostridia bacterium]|nr:tRNA uridine-5-carboxymethylaminomethyl(34) synthesis GTPase MnmE [Clostridia bacterium]
MSTLFSTIAAVSTPRGKGGVAVIRLSGPDAISAAARFFKPKSGRDLSSCQPRTAVFGSVLDADDLPVDEALCTVFRAPASFTGEDVAEISCHGGLAVTEAVYLSALAHGASAAGPGEFTRRAFLNGKLSLTESEAVGLLIDADTKERLALSGGAVRGNVSRKIEQISASLLDVMTALYAAIDYPEEDVGDEGEREIGAALCRAHDEVSLLLNTYKAGRAITEGVKTVICGRPNVGKSSLFNQMVGDESAIVTSVAGTTRDILRETVSFGGVTLRISDTAGIRLSGDVVEQIGIDRAEQEMRSAELLLAVFDGSAGLTGEDRELLGKLGECGGAKIAVINKADLGERISEDDLSLIRASADRTVTVSAKESRGMEELAGVIAALYGSDRLNPAEDAVIWDVRQREMLAKSRTALAQAAEGIEYGAPIDAVCTLAEEALAALNETDGRGIDETIVDEIFKRFCVGK